MLKALGFVVLVCAFLIFGWIQGFIPFLWPFA
jgi:hypothetical protein